MVILFLVLCSFVLFANGDSSEECFYYGWCGSDSSEELYGAFGSFGRFRSNNSPGRLKGSRSYIGPRRYGFTRGHGSLTQSDAINIEGVDHRIVGIPVYRDRGIESSFMGYVFYNPQQAFAIPELNGLDLGSSLIQGADLKEGIRETFISRPGDNIGSLSGSSDQGTRAIAKLREPNNETGLSDRGVTNSVTGSLDKLKPNDLMGKSETGSVNLLQEEKNTSGFSSVSGGTIVQGDVQRGKITILTNADANKIDIAPTILESNIEGRKTPGSSSRIESLGQLNSLVGGHNLRNKGVSLNSPVGRLVESKSNLGSLGDTGTTKLKLSSDIKKQETVEGGKTTLLTNDTTKEISPHPLTLSQSDIEGSKVAGFLNEDAAQSSVRETGASGSNSATVGNIVSGIIQRGKITILTNAGTKSANPKKVAQSEVTESEVLNSLSESENVLPPGSPSGNREGLNKSAALVHPRERVAARLKLLSSQKRLQDEIKRGKITIVTNASTKSTANPEEVTQSKVGVSEVVDSLIESENIFPPSSPSENREGLNESAALLNPREKIAARLKSLNSRKRPQGAIQRGKITIVTNAGTNSTVNPEEVTQSKVGASEVLNSLNEGRNVLPPGSSPENRKGLNESAALVHPRQKIAARLKSLSSRKRPQGAIRRGKINIVTNAGTKSTANLEQVEQSKVRASEVINTLSESETVLPPGSPPGNRESLNESAALLHHKENVTARVKSLSSQKRPRGEIQRGKITIVTNAGTKSTVNPKEVTQLKVGVSEVVNSLTESENIFPPSSRSENREGLNESAALVHPREKVAARLKSLSGRRRPQVASRRGKITTGPNAGRKSTANPEEVAQSKVGPSEVFNSLRESENVLLPASPAENREGLNKSAPLIHPKENVKARVKSLSSRKRPQEEIQRGKITSGTNAGTKSTVNPEKVTSLKVGASEILNNLTKTENVLPPESAPQSRDGLNKNTALVVPSDEKVPRPDSLSSRNAAIQHEEISILPNAGTKPTANLAEILVAKVGGGKALSTLGETAAVINPVSNTENSDIGIRNSTGELNVVRSNSKKDSDNIQGVLQRGSIGLVTNANTRTSGVPLPLLHENRQGIAFSPFSSGSGAFGQFNNLGGSGTFDRLNDFRGNGAFNQLNTLGRSGAFSHLNTLDRNGAFGRLNALGSSRAFSGVNTLGENGAFSRLNTLNGNRVFDRLTTLGGSGASRQINTFGRNKPFSQLNALDGRQTLGNRRNLFSLPSKRLRGEILRGRGRLLVPSSQLKRRRPSKNFRDRSAALVVPSKRNITTSGNRGRGFLSTKSSSRLTSISQTPEKHLGGGISIQKDSLILQPQLSRGTGGRNEPFVIPFETLKKLRSKGGRSNDLRFAGQEDFRGRLVFIDLDKPDNSRTIINTLAN